MAGMHSRVLMRAQGTGRRKEKARSLALRGPSRGPQGRSGSERKGWRGPEGVKAEEEDPGAYHFPVRLGGMRRERKRGDTSLSLSLAQGQGPQPRSSHRQGQRLRLPEERGPGPKPARPAGEGLCLWPQASGGVLDVRMSELSIRRVGLSGSPPTALPGGTCILCCEL